MKTSKDFGVEINADWGRNVYTTIHNESEKTIEEAQEYAEKIKDEFGDPTLESTVVDVEII